MSRAKNHTASQSQQRDDERGDIIQKIWYRGNINSGYKLVRARNGFFLIGGDFLFKVSI